MNISDCRNTCCEKQGPCLNVRLSDRKSSRRTIALEVPLNTRNARENRSSQTAGGRVFALWPRLIGQLEQAQPDSSPAFHSTANSRAAAWASRTTRQNNCNEPLVQTLSLMWSIYSVPEIRPIKNSRWISAKIEGLFQGTRRRIAVGELLSSKV